MSAFGASHQSSEWDDGVLIGLREAGAAPMGRLVRVTCMQKRPPSKLVQPPPPQRPQRRLFCLGVEKRALGTSFATRSRFLATATGAPSLQRLAPIPNQDDVKRSVGVAASERFEWLLRMTSGGTRRSVLTCMPDRAPVENGDLSLRKGGSSSTEIPI